ncbi:hypothetical protein MCHI_002943 [Candidatus Magnetoovum chiemensis]|nr:hypothetical protein MCHI_002943 [Candidatus Magnetoovum chiemensis]
MQAVIELEMGLEMDSIINSVLRDWRKKVKKSCDIFATSADLRICKILGNP